MISKESIVDPFETVVEIAIDVVPFAALIALVIWLVGFDGFKGLLCMFGVLALVGIFSRTEGR